MLGQKNVFFTKTAFWMWVANALYHSLVSTSRIVPSTRILYVRTGPVCLLRHFVLGRLEASYRIRLRPLGMGNDALPRCAPYSARKGCPSVRVCIDYFQFHMLYSYCLFSSLWTKYTVAGKLCDCTSRLHYDSDDRLAIPGSFVFTMLFLPLYAVVAPAIGFSREYQNIVPRLWSDAVFYFVLLLVPILCLSRDFVWK